MLTRTLTHYQFAKSLFPLLPPKNALRRAFLFGCIEPDINLFSHLDLTKREKKPHFHGHNHPYLDQRITRLACKLHRQQTKSSPLYFFRLGVLLHYLADSFTFAHNMNFHGNFRAHNAYENALHDYFLKRLCRLSTSFFQTTHRFDYNKFRVNYLKTKPSLASDFSFILLATRAFLHAFLPKHKILR